MKQILKLFVIFVFYSCSSCKIDESTENVVSIIQETAKDKGIYLELIKIPAYR